MPIRNNYDYGENVFSNLDEFKSISEFLKKHKENREKRQSKIRQMVAKAQSLPSFIDGYDRSFMDNPEMETDRTYQDSPYLESAVSVENNIIPEPDADGKQFPTINYSANIDSDAEPDIDLEDHLSSILFLIDGSAGNYRTGVTTDDGVSDYVQNKYYVVQDTDHPDTERDFMQPPIKTDSE